MTDEIVYSTDPGFCPACGRSPCTCSDKKKRRQPEPVRISFSRVSKGSGMTRVERLNMHPRLKDELLKRFKKRLGCGGTVKDGVVELQGDRRDFLQKELESEGYKVKRVGG
ncbi:MAG: stress response translation initiation inhibitor YciH [Elusimicrobiota bacterium]